MANVPELRIKVDRDWLALVCYRSALQEIVDEYELEGWGFSGEEAADMAREVLEAFAADGQEEGK